MPQLRFPGFERAWDCHRIDWFLKRVVSPVDVKAECAYREIGVRSHGKGIFHKAEITGRDLANKRVFWVQKNTFIVNIVFAWEHAIALTSDAEEGFIASHRFPMFSSLKNRSYTPFVRHFFLRKRGKYLLGLASPGGAGRNKTLGQSTFAELKVTFPPLPEQQKIASFLSAVDEKIAQLTHKKELLEQYKKGGMQKLFSQAIRFKDDNGDEFPDWKKRELKDILQYEQPTKYLVSNSDYDDSYATPVLTAGKTFLLGYTGEKNGVFSSLPVIIFDDFTTASQFVDFPFKAKSSAMKMLSLVNEDENIRFAFEAIQMIKFPLGEHKRHWISEYQNWPIMWPSLGEQQKIANFLTTIDTKIDLTTQKLNHAKVFKKGLLQQMFI